MNLRRGWSPFFQYRKRKQDFILQYYYVKVINKGKKKAHGLKETKEGSLFMSFFLKSKGQPYSNSSRKK
jgi:hypothetical protein